MTREQLLDALRLCADETKTEACKEKCPLYGTKGDCIAALLNEARAEIIFLEAVCNAHAAIEDTMSRHLKRQRTVDNGQSYGD